RSMMYPEPTLQTLARNFPAEIPLKQMTTYQGFGENRVSFYAELGMLGHNGVDLRASTGTPIYADTSGEISWAYDGDRDTYGYFIFLRTEAKTIGGHIIRMESVFAHLDKLNVKTGDRVSTGDLIAWSDNTGKYTTGPHLHYGRRPLYGEAGVWIENGYRGYVDPLPFLGARAPELPVDRRYGIPRTWSGWNRERAFVMDGLTWRIIGRPTSRQIKASAYGEWSLAEIADPAMYQVWTELAKVDYKNLIRRMIAGGIATDIGSVINHLHLV
ncbi:MAG: M23 family metallopeptidase, partial [Parcubacteria group bacterium]|nr:M23 family metallopeptidase [Parcubacteria group bacterium]